MFDNVDDKRKRRCKQGVDQKFYQEIDTYQTGKHIYEKICSGCPLFEYVHKENREKNTEDSGVNYRSAQGSKNNAERFSFFQRFTDDRRNKPRHCSFKETYERGRKRICREHHRTADIRAVYTVDKCDKTEKKSESGAFRNTENGRAENDGYKREREIERPDL